MIRTSCGTLDSSVRAGKELKPDRSVVNNLADRDVQVVPVVVRVWQGSDSRVATSTAETAPSRQSHCLHSTLAL